VINDGDIVEQGSHSQLLAAGGFYASLYRSQFEAAEAGNNMILTQGTPGDMEGKDRRQGYDAAG
jgi:hypothetical protein